MATRHWDVVIVGAGPAGLSAALVLGRARRRVLLCDTGNLSQAEEHLAKRMNDVREAQLHGLRPQRTFRAAATKYLEDYASKKSIADFAVQLKLLDPFVGELDLKNVHMGTLQESSPNGARKA